MPNHLGHGDDRRTVPQTRHDGGRHLPAGFRLQEFVIEGLIGEGGFSIVYLARDTRLQRHVALKEYIPTSLALRDTDHHVRVRLQEHRRTFELGLRSFVNEAQLLAAFDHPSLIRVYRFWEENGTAYMVMPYVQAPTLKHWLTVHRAPLDEAWLRTLFLSLIDALELIHADRCYHRDIAPDNILLLGDATAAPRPLLLDFGAARRMISDATQTLTVMLKPGYAPIEQYADNGGARQGPWTDIYALCSVMYAAIMRKAPAPSVSRIIDDEVVPLSRIAAGLYSPQLLSAIDAGMAVRPEQRPQSAAALRALLTSEAAATSVHEPPSDAFMHAPAVPTPMPARSDDRRDQRIEPPVRAPLPDEITGGRRGQPAPSADARAALRRVAEESYARPPAPSALRAPARWLGGLLLLLGLGFVAWQLYDERTPQLPDVATIEGGTQQPASAAAGPPAAAAAAPPSPPEAPATKSEPTIAAPGAPASAASLFGSLPALQQIVRGADPHMGVIATAEKPTMVIGRDRLRVRVQSAQAGYVYLYFASTDRRVYLLFPTASTATTASKLGRRSCCPRRAGTWSQRALQVPITWWRWCRGIAATSAAVGCARGAAFRTSTCGSPNGGGPIRATRSSACRSATVRIATTLGARHWCRSSTWPRRRAASSGRTGLESSSRSDLGTPPGCDPPGWVLQTSSQAPCRPAGATRSSVPSTTPDWFQVRNLCAQITAPFFASSARIAST